ncbi:catecholate siderophore receptor Fiu [Duganella sp. FT27W]|uniref:catecholate siderophore receptor Fiu n=1 Tax=Duganella sp. FT27W TaxID=2654636 RepID=UPI00128C0DEC|nr:catecholate siderophore receptor Fiu [Duganella sp. FT27W]MPQ59063.1 catecholate siderophore receptor Fiu [Duganella sp. FT27W]
MIKSRKHAQSRFNQHMSAALAAMLLPVAAHAVAAADEQAQAPQTLSEVKVQGAAEDTFKADRAVSAKYTEKLVDTAQTITVIKKELIEQQGAVSLTEALRNTPGVGAFFLGENGNTNTGDAIFMRGFDTSGSIYVDGVRDVGSITRDIFNIEQIDVLKGPAGTDNGRSAPTGSINLVSKRPQLEDAYLGSATVGSGKQRRATADVNQVINADSGTAFRLNALVQDSENPARDMIKNKRWAVAPSLAFGLNGPTRFYLNFLHVKQDNIPDGGVLTIGLPGYTPPYLAAATTGTPAAIAASAAAAAADRIRLAPLATAPRVNPKNFYGSEKDHDNVTADQFTARLEHDFANGVKLQNTTRYGKNKQDYLLTAFMATSANLIVTGTPDTWTMARSTLTYKDQTNKVLTNQTNVTAEFGTGAVKHTLVAGLEFITEKQTNYTLATTAGTAITRTSIYNPNPATPQTFTYARTGAQAVGNTDTQAVYLFDTAKFGDWIINGGLRLDHFSTTYDSVAIQGTATPQTIPVGTRIATNLKVGDTLVNGKLSALYKLTPESSVYALAASSKAPPGGTNFSLSANANSAANPNYDPQETTNYEFGGKWDLLQQKLSLSAAVYRTTVKNEVEQDATSGTYFQTGEKRNQGVELGVTGEITRGWLVSAGYTRMSAKVTNGRAVAADGEVYLAYTPKQSFTSWTSYTLPFGLTVGGGVRFNDQLRRGTDGAVGTPSHIDSYWVADAMASYPLNKHIDLRLNVYNLTDKEYVAAINKSGYRYTPGQPRSGSLTANIKF